MAKEPSPNMRKKRRLRAYTSSSTVTCPFRSIARVSYNFAPINPAETEVSGEPFSV